MSTPDLEGLTRKDFLSHKQAVLEESNKREIGPREIVVDVQVENVDDPFVIVPLGDLHAGAGSTRWDEVKKHVELICHTPGMIVIGTGDWIEAVEEKHGIDKIQNSLTLDEQFALLRQHVTEPLVRAGKLKACVRRHVAHEGHLKKSIGDDPWNRILEGYDVPQVVNGGRVNLVLHGRDGREKKVAVQVFHNTPGKSGKNTMRSLENVANRYGNENRPDIVLGAHDHRSVTGILEGSVLVRGGTPKGNEQNGDPYGATLGLPGTDPMGQMVVAWGNHGGAGREMEMWPAIEPMTGLAMYGAMSLLNNLEAQKLADEVLEELRSKDKTGGKATLDEKRSRVAVGGLVNDVVEPMPEYQSAVWRIDTAFAVGLIMPSNLRYGSRAHDDSQEPWLTDMLAQRNIYAILGRQAVDRKIPNSREREMWVDAMLEMMQTAEGRVLGVLYDAVFKNSAWSRPIRIDKETVLPPVMAATDTTRELNTVLVKHMGQVVIDIGQAGRRVVYSDVIMDDLENRGATDSATAGLRTVYEARLTDKPAIVMGGHMPKRGVAQFHDQFNPHTKFPTLVANGWGAISANWRPGNHAEAPADGLGSGVILLPGGLGIFKDDFAVIPVGRRDQWMMLDAVDLLIGARRGLISPDKLTRKS